MQERIARQVRPDLRSKTIDKIILGGRAADIGEGQYGDRVGWRLARAKQPRSPSRGYCPNSRHNRAPQDDRAPPNSNSPSGWLRDGRRLFFSCRKPETIAHFGDGLDSEDGIGLGQPSQPPDHPVDGILADNAAIPAAGDQLVAGYHPSPRLMEGDQNLRRLGLQRLALAVADHLTGRGTDLQRPQR